MGSIPRSIDLAARYSCCQLETVRVGPVGLVVDGEELVLGDATARVGMGQAGSGRQSRMSSVKGQAPRSMSAMAASPSARARSATASEIRPCSSTRSSSSSSFQRQWRSASDDDIEPEVAHIEAEGRAAEGLLKVHVPAEELPVGCPPDPGRAPLARDHEHEHVPAFPDAVDELPLSLEPGARLPRDDRQGEFCGRACRQPERDELGGVLDDDHRFHVDDYGCVLATLGNKGYAVEDRLTALKAGWLAGPGHGAW